MTADELMRLVSRYVEACDDLGEGLFEKPLSTTDALHAKATELHGQILAEVYRLHAEAGEAHRLRESERALVATLRDEMDEGLRLRELGGARPDEGITAMTERIVSENAQLRAELARLDAAAKSALRLSAAFHAPATASASARLAAVQPSHSCPNRCTCILPSAA